MTFADAPKSKSHVSPARGRYAHLARKLPVRSPRMASWYGGGASAPQSALPKNTRRLRSSTAPELQMPPQPRLRPGPRSGLPFGSSMGSTSKRRRIFPVLASSATMAPRYPVTPSVVMPTKTRFLKTAGDEKMRIGSFGSCSQLDASGLPQTTRFQRSEPSLALRQYIVLPPAK